MGGKKKRRFFKIKSLIFFTFCIALISATIYVTLELTTSDRKYNSLPLHPEDGTTEIVFQLEESLLEGITEVMEIIPLELELTEKLIIDESWGNIGVFKKLQRIYYKGLGIYSVDLSAIERPSVEMTNDNITIVLSVPEPKIKSCTIIEDKTLYEDTEKGLLRFGEITLTIEEQLLLSKEVTNRMKKRMEDPELLWEAMESTRLIIKNLTDTLAKDLTQKDLEVIVVFENAIT